MRAFLLALFVLFLVGVLLVVVRAATMVVWFIDFVHFLAQLGLK